MVEVASSLCNNGSVKSISTVKFVCSYGGKILPRPTDGKLRYFGGETRVLSVDRSISFAELLVKLAELCGFSVSLRCQLPYEDLDALISITTDEDLENLVEEYDRTGQSKIKAFLFPLKSIKQISPPSSATSVSAAVGSRVWNHHHHHHQAHRTVHQPLVYYKRSGGSKPCYYPDPPVPHRNPSPIYFLHQGNHWQ